MKAILILITLSLAATDAWAQRGVLAVELSSDQKELHITVTPTRSGGLALLQLFDPATGRAVRTLYAGPTGGAKGIAITKSSGLPAGAYKLRFRQGVELDLDKEIEPTPDLKTGFLNPTDVVVLDKWVYVMDAGFAGLYDPADVPPLREWKTGNTAHSGRFYQLQSGYLTIVTKAGPHVRINAAELSPDDIKLANAYAAKKKQYGETHRAAIYRFTRDGRPDPTFGDRGRVFSPVNAASFRALNVDDEGFIYLPSGGHNLIKLPADGSKPIHSIGGWDNDPHGPKCTPWARSPALGGENRVYIPNDYGHMKAYDRTKSGFAGIISTVRLPRSIGLDRATAADRQGRVYHIGNDQRLRRFLDEGAAMKLEYATDPADKLCAPTGPSASGGLVWVACHGPGLGPYWDSGGGGEVVLYWDDQVAKKLTPIMRYGAPGAGDSPTEFLNPSAAIMSRDQTDLWVAEDGLQNHEGPPGNARVRRYLIKSAQADDLDFTLPAWR